MMPILIADSGSTKTQWCVVNEVGDTLEEFLTSGINPALMPAAEVDAGIGTALRKKRLAPARVYYYGAGCTPDRSFVVRNALQRLYPQAEIMVSSDLIAAVHALCGEDEGIACILGTGMASCLCADGKVLQQTPSLGYVLGDEGSGAVLGRRLLGAVFKESLPKDLCVAWQTKYGLPVAEVISKVYREPQPNRFLASFVPFLAEHRDESAVKALLTDEFRTFFRRNIVPYKRPDLPVNLVGGVAANFKEELKQAALAEGLTVGTVLQAPMLNLVAYHVAH